MKRTLKNNKALKEYQAGGNITNTGYLNDSPDRFNSFNIIPSSTITMNNVSQDIMAYPDKGQPKLMKKNSGLHKFPGADFVKEVPVAQNGMNFSPRYNMPSAYMFDHNHPDYPTTAKDSAQYRNVFFNNVKNPGGVDAQTLWKAAMNNYQVHNENTQDVNKAHYIYDAINAAATQDAQYQMNGNKSTYDPKKQYQVGGQPKLVKEVPSNYIPYPQMGANYYHNPQSSSSAGVPNNGPKMSDGDWAKFVKANPNWNKQQSDDIVYTQPHQPISIPTPVMDQPSYMNMHDHMFDGSNHAVGAIGWNEKASNTQTNDGQQNTMNNRPSVNFAFYKPNTASIDPNKVYSNIPAPVFDKMSRGNTTMLGDTTGLYQYKIPVNPSLAKKQKGGIIKAQNGIAYNQYTNDQYDNTANQQFLQNNTAEVAKYNLPRNQFSGTQVFPGKHDPKMKTMPKVPGKGISPYAADMLGAGLSFFGDATYRDPNNQQYQTTLGGSDAQNSTYAGDRGDYTTNEGYFRPNQQIASQFTSPGYDQYGNPLQKASLGLAFGNNMETSSLNMPTPDFGNTAAPAVAAPNTSNTSDGMDMRSRGTDVATKTNNPGNMKYHSWMSKFGAVNSGIPGKDGGTFAEFPDLQSGLKAYQTQLFGTVDGVMNSSYYKPNTTVDQALKTWSNDGYGVDIYPELKGKTLAEVTPEQRLELSKRQIKKESNKMYSLLNNEGVFNKPIANFNVNGQAGLNNASPWAINLGNALQQNGDGNLSVNSIYRTPEHNQEVGGKPNSQHLKGTALDINPSYWNKLDKNAQNQILANFNAKAIDEGNHIHIQKAYKEGGEYELSAKDILKIMQNGGQIEYLN